MTRAILFLTLLGLLLLIGVPAYYYAQLPEIIPSHFGPGGEPDATGHKSYLWVLPALGVLLFIGMSFLVRYPHKLNYPVKITPENASAQYRLGQDLIHRMNSIIIWMLLYITNATIQTAFEKVNGLNAWVMIGFFVLLFGTIGHYMYQVLQKK